MGRLDLSAVVRALRLRKPSVSSSQTNVRPQDNRSLERELRGWQIFMILISGIIGGLIIFGAHGQYLRTAGPAGLMTALLYVGFNAIFVMEGLSELIVLWPVSNAMVEYVRVFVDEDLALVVGLAYWYSWSSFVATMFVVAANSATYWDLPTFWQTSAFYILGPIVILGINWIGVKWYGWVEGILGIVKLFFVAAAALFLLIIGAHNGSKYINAGYHADKTATPNQTSAVLLIIPYLTYGFLGVETVAVAAFEARDPRNSLRASAKWIAYVITFLFVVCGIGQTLNVAWNSTQLPMIEFRRLKLKSRDHPQATGDFSVLVLAALNYGDTHAAGAWNIFLIISSLSAANTCLYVASRTLYGLCRELPQDHSSRLKRWPAKLGTLDPRTRVPFWALLASTASFFWLPFLQLRKGYSAQNLIDVMITVGCVGCVLVWASQCLAYIRYFNWLRAHKQDLEQLKEEDSRTYNPYDRENMNKKERFHNLLGPAQPAPAYLGLVMCLLTVFIFSSATWWKKPATAKKVFVAYTGPIACLLLWLGLKAWRYHQTNKLIFWTNLSYNPRRFQEIINHFEALLYLRDEDEGSDGDSGRHVGMAEVVGQRGLGMNGTVREPGYENVQRRMAGGIVGVGAGTHNLNSTTELPAPVIRPDEPLYS